MEIIIQHTDILFKQSYINNSNKYEIVNEFISVTLNIVLHTITLIFNENELQSFHIWNWKSHFNFR